MQQLCPEEVVVQGAIWKKYFFEKKVLEYSILLDCCDAISTQASTKTEGAHEMMGVWGELGEGI